MKPLSIVKVILIMYLLLLPFYSSCQSENTKSGWIKADFHMHTTMTDGDNTPDEVVTQAIENFGLDFVALSEHGGQWYRLNKNFERTDKVGNVLFDGKKYIPIRDSEKSWYKNYSRTIQIKEFSFPEVIKFRNEYPDKLILQGLEWDIPGHDHGSVAIIDDNADPICQFHYMFDRGDLNYIEKGRGDKYCENLHENALIGIEYLADNYPNESYFVVNHPSRKIAFSAADFRDFNNASPEVCIGFEGIPGHQKSPGIRCEYDKFIGDGINYDSRTYGGADFVLSEIGGVWDALLGEGRKFWVFTNSDYHRAYSDFYPGEYAVNYIFSEGKDYESLIKAMKSGNIFIVQNNLITDLIFSINSGDKTATMGQTLAVEKNSVVKIKIKFVSSEREAYGKSLSVDHIDLICGDVTGLIDPATEEYTNPHNITTHIKKQFDNSKFEKENNLSTISYEMVIDKPIYLRLRGTNVPVNTPNETDEFGNPLDDNLVGENNEEKALTDLWFYSNPIFIVVTK